MDKTIITLLMLTLSATVFSKGKDHDPNGYFRPRSWSMDDGSQKNNHYIFASSTYQGEPVQKPNNLEVEHRCGLKKTIPMVTIKYCGLDSIKIVGNKLEVMFVDFNYKDSRGYCTKKRTQYFEIPSCNKTTTKQ